MIKKRSRPQPRVREREVSPETPEMREDEEDPELPIADLIELRKLRKARQGIDAAKLSIGDAKKRKKRAPAEVEEAKGGLTKGFAEILEGSGDSEEEDEEEKEARMRRVVRANNFTGQTNALDVDKHMMAYIEENLTIRGRPLDPLEEKATAYDPQEELYRISDRWRTDKKKGEEGNVTNSMTMLTAIPEVDLGMDTRLKNIEETEKAKRVVVEERHDRKKINNDEAHLAANRFYQPNLKQKSDTDILRDAKLEALGLPIQEDQSNKRTHQDRPQMATDEIVMERFKKRMRKQ